MGIEIFNSDDSSQVIKLDNVSCIEDFPDVILINYNDGFTAVSKNQGYYITIKC